MATRGSTSNPLVILVDDEPLLLRAWRRLLTGLPIRLRCFEDPAAALEAVRAERPGLVVSDHHMPGMTGLELLARIRREDPAIDLVLFTTDAGAIRRAERHGLRVLDKSGSPEELRKLVGAVVSGRAAPRSR